MIWRLFDRYLKFACLPFFTPPMTLTGVSCLCDICKSEQVTIEMPVKSNPYMTLSAVEKRRDVGDINSVCFRLAQQSRDVQV